MVASSIHKPNVVLAPRRGVPKALVIFWGIFACITVAGIAVLQYLGPPVTPLPPEDIHHGGAGEMSASLPPKPVQAIAVKPAAPLAMMMTAKPTAPAMPPRTPPPEMGTGSTLAAGMPIPAPIPTLLGPSVTEPDWLVPRVGPGGMTPMQAYAASIPAGSGPRVAVLVAGIGDDDSQSQEAITTLPSAISLAFDPYAQHIADIAALARASGHELLLAIPMQEVDPAAENAGNKALVMAGPITVDQPLLDWSLSQFQGYVGVTDAIGATQGGGFMENPNAKAWLMQEVADKGLFFIDARQTGTTPYAWNRTADVVVDTVMSPQKEAAQLAELAADAKQQGNALGILLTPAPASLQTLAAWTQSLENQGITLVPVSALVLPPINALATVNP